MRQGFVRIINYSPRSGSVSMVAIDDGGRRFDGLSVELGGFQTVHFNSEDLESGNPSKGLAQGTGVGEGHWRLELASDLDIEVLAYVRTSDGFLTSMHDVAPGAQSRHRLGVFNPASNPDQKSLLRLTNPHDEPVQISIEGIDDRGESPGSGVSVELGPRESRMLTAIDLESGAASGLSGALDDGRGKWKLVVESSQPVSAMSLMESSDGILTNLSSLPSREADGNTHRVPLFPAASDPLGRQGFVRVINHGSRAGEVRIDAFDDSGQAYDALAMSIGANTTLHFNSDDLELGNVDKGLTGSTGAGSGDWWLRFTSELEIEVLSYIRTQDGFLTSMHDTAPVAATRHTVAVFNPGSNTNQRSMLRLVNPGDQSAEATIVSVDDGGASARGGVRVVVPPLGALTLEAAELEAGSSAFAGSLGDGVGKWRLEVESRRPIFAMSLLASPTGHLTNLSSVPTQAGPGTVPRLPPFDGTVFLHPLVIVDGDPSSLHSVSYGRRGNRSMFDRRINAFATYNAHLFRAEFDDGMDIEIQVNPEFDADTARMEARFYAQAIGQLPAGLRERVETVWIHDGDELFGGGNDNILIHTGEFAQDYIRRGFLEEVLIHESAHTSIDPIVGTGTEFHGEDMVDPLWVEARTEDGGFVSTYGRDFPNREDVAESFGAYLAMRQAPGRVPVAIAQAVRRAMPNRIAYFDRLNLDFRPMISELPTGGVGRTLRGEAVASARDRRR